MSGLLTIGPSTILDTGGDTLHTRVLAVRLGALQTANRGQVEHHGRHCGTATDRRILDQGHEPLSVAFDVQLDAGRAVRLFAWNTDS